MLVTPPARGTPRHRARAPLSGLFIWGLVHFLKPFVAHFLLQTSLRLIHIFWGGRKGAFFEEESCISALCGHPKCHLYFTFWTLAPAPRLGCPAWGRVLWDSPFTFQTLNPVCSTLNLSLVSASLCHGSCSQCPQGMAWLVAPSPAGHRAGPGSELEQKPAPPWKRRSITGKHDLLR